MGMNNVYYPFVEMTQDPELKGLPPGLRMQAYATHGGVTKSNLKCTHWLLVLWANATFV